MFTQSCPKAGTCDECHGPAFLGQSNCLSLPDTVGKGLLPGWRIPEGQGETLLRLSLKPKEYKCRLNRFPTLIINKFGNIANLVDSIPERS